MFCKNMLTLLKKTIKTGWLNFIRNSAISIATCFIIGMTIFLITSLLIMKDVADYLINVIQEKVDISIYLKDTVAEEEILVLKDEIAKIPEVKEVQYVSRAEALDRFVERYKNNPVVIESLAEVGNPLLPALNVKAWQANQYDAVVSFLENSPSKDLIDKVDYHERKPVIDRISAMTATFNALGIIMSLVLAIVAILVAFNQVRLAIYNAREEIAIQRLVGASNWFIRGPFLAQGAIIGIFASLGTLLIFSIAVFYLGPKIAIVFSGFDVSGYFFSKFFPIFLLQFIFGVGLGISSSWLAVRKYLR